MVTGSTNIVESCRHGPMTEEERLADERDKALMQCNGSAVSAHCDPSLRALTKTSKAIRSFRLEDVWRMKLDSEMRSFTGRQMRPLGITWRDGFRCRSRSDRSYFHCFASIS